MGIKFKNMKQSNLSFAEGFLGVQAQAAKDKPMMAFDWDKAAEKIKELLPKYPNLVAEAGLQGDWAHTGGVIFENGVPTNEDYTYLGSNWATPTLIITCDDFEKEIDCFIEDSGRFGSSSKWDRQSLSILGLSVA